MHWEVSLLTADSGSQGVVVREGEVDVVFLEERVVTCLAARQDAVENAGDDTFLWLLHYYMMKVQADDRTGREDMPDMQGDEAIK